MRETILVAIIAAIPPTLAAIAALWRVARLTQPLNDVNRAVNHRQVGQRTLVETVDYIAGELQHMRSEMERHQAYHQVRDEEAGLD